MSEMIYTGATAPVTSKAEPVFNVKIGNCEYIVGVHFNKNSRDSLEDRLKRMIRNEVLAMKS